MMRDDAGLAIEFFREIGLVHLQRYRHGAQYVRRQTLHGGVIGQHGLFEIVRPLRPDVRRVHLRAGGIDARCQICGALRAEGECLLDVGRRDFAHRISHRAVAEPVVAAADLGRRPLHFHFLRNRQREKIDGALPRGLDQILRHAVAGDNEEAGVDTSRIDLPRHIAFVRRAAVAQRRHVDRRDRVCACRCHGRPPVIIAEL